MPALQVQYKAIPGRENRHPHALAQLGLWRARRGFLGTWSNDEPRDRGAWALLAGGTPGHGHYRGRAPARYHRCLFTGPFAAWLGGAELHEDYVDLPP